MTTNASGEAFFSGRAGEYEVTVFDDSYEQQTTQIHVNKSSGSTIQLVVQQHATGAEGSLYDASDNGYILFLIFACGTVLFAVIVWKKKRAK